ncbi:MAG: thioredoxin [Thermoplasmata archaeon]
MKNVVELDDRNFDAEVTAASTPVLVDFSAEWCGPCKVLAPIVEEIAGEYNGRLKVAHLDIDNGRQTAARFGIMTVPTLLFFKNGKVCDQYVGAAAKKVLVDRISRILS